MGFIKALILTYIFMIIMVNTGTSFPDLIFILVIGSAAILNPIPALALGFVNGLFLDFLNPETLGLNTLLLTISAYVAIRINAVFFQKLAYRYVFLVGLFLVVAILRSSSLISIITTVLIMVPILYLIQNILFPSWRGEL